MTTITAQTILRSRNTSAPDKVLSTLLLRYPRFIHAEFMTHRVFSRNAASSRAIPVKKMIDDILADTAMPIHWGAAQKGMQANNEVDRETAAQAAAEWRIARGNAIRTAQSLLDMGLHKQVANRLLEPFMHITVLVSSTEWDNFLELRDHKDAEPHIQMLAREIRKCLDDESTIHDLAPGQWHLPFVSRYESGEMIEQIIQEGAAGADLRKLSVARCASTSYKTTDGFDMTLERAEAIYDKLVNSKPVHGSPLEHVAQADEYDDWENGGGAWLASHEHRNFVGFRQYRAMIGA